MAIGMIIFEDKPDGTYQVEIHYEPVPQKAADATDAQNAAYDVMEYIKDCVARGSN